MWNRAEQCSPCSEYLQLSKSDVFIASAECSSNKPLRYVAASFTQHEHPHNIFFRGRLYCFFFFKHPLTDFAELNAVAVLCLFRFLCVCVCVRWWTNYLIDVAFFFVLLFNPLTRMRCQITSLEHGICFIWPVESREERECVNNWWTDFRWGRRCRRAFT